MRCELQAKRYEILYHVCAGWWWYGTALHCNMTVLCRTAPYISRTKLIIIHLNWLMIVWCRCCTRLSSADTDTISRLKLQGCLLEEKVILSSQLQCYCCLDAETSFLFSCGVVSLRCKSKVNQLYSLSARIVWVYFWPLLHFAGQPCSCQLNLLHNAHIATIITYSQFRNRGTFPIIY